MITGNEGKGKPQQWIININWFNAVIRSKMG